MLLYLFFFSSRRRHTRLQGDWSSDVCSSDLSDRADAEDVLRRATALDDFMMRNQLDASARNGWQALRLDMSDLARAYGITWNRSEERRVGKECRERWARGAVKNRKR